MREIKFRAWDDREHRMLSATDLENQNRAIGSNGLVVGYDADGSRMGHVWKCDWIIPMQYTGLHDKNGKEIYEGDIIRSKETNEVLKIGEITPLSRHLELLAENIGYYDGKKYHLRSAGGQYHLDDWVSWPEMYEVIGNIYENPELLTKKEV